MVFMMSLFAAEVGVMLWILIGNSLLNDGPLPASVEICLVIS